MTSFIKVVEMLKKTYTQQITIDYFGLSQNTVINMLRTVGVHRAATHGAQSNVPQRFDVTSDTDYMYKVYKSILKSNMYNFNYSPFTVMTL